MALTPTSNPQARTHARTLRAPPIRALQVLGDDGDQSPVLAGGDDSLGRDYGSYFRYGSPAYGRGGGGALPDGRRYYDDAGMVSPWQSTPGKGEAGAHLSMSGGMARADTAARTSPTRAVFLLMNAILGSG